MSSNHLEVESIKLLAGALHELDHGFADLPAMENPFTISPGMENVLTDVAHRLQDNYPYFHPLYAGQMMKPPHPIARLAYCLALWLNPNNHALDGGRASSAMEKEAVAEIAGLFGWTQHLGHLTSGGTMANLEALWVAGQLQPGKKVVASAQAHYTHARISHVLGLSFESVPCDSRGRMDLAVLEAKLRFGDVGTVVATIGTTATGSLDPLPEIMALKAQHGFRLHADAAYGGYFILTDNLAPSTRQIFNSLGAADSIVVDPHKHGLQPYGCGCVLFADPAVGRLYQHESPYTYFTSDQLHLGEISLECSRPGAAAVALWATQRLLPLKRGGEFAQGLNASRDAALAFSQRLQQDPRFLTSFAPELDIVVWAPRAHSVTAASQLAQQLFNACARRNLHFALATLPIELFGLDSAGVTRDAPVIKCLRSVLMKPEHRAWIDRIWDILVQSCGDLVI